MTEIDQLILDLLEKQRGPFFFVGTGKNSGKTTLLNEVNRVLSGAGRVVGVTTIGHDGEAFDSVLGHPKPPVMLYPGNLASMTEQMAADAGSALAVVETTDHETVVGTLVLTKALRETRAEILGPETNAQSMALCEKLESLGAGIVLADGAFSRRTQIAGRVGGALALIVSGDIGETLRDIEMQTRFWVETLTLPGFAQPLSSSLPDALGIHEIAGDLVALRGPLTDDIARRLVDSIDGRRLVIEDGTKVFCSKLIWKRLKKSSGGIFALRTFNLVLIAANPTARCRNGFLPRPFAEAVKRSAGIVPVVDVIERILMF
jgi:hypothetical protein